MHSIADIYWKKWMPSECHSECLNECMSVFEISLAAWQAKKKDMKLVKKRRRVSGKSQFTFKLRPKWRATKSAVRAGCPPSVPPPPPSCWLPVSKWRSKLVTGGDATKKKRQWRVGLLCVWRRRLWRKWNVQLCERDGKRVRTHTTYSLCVCVCGIE